MLYVELRRRCLEMSFCFDISNSIVPRGDLYYDSRDMNKEGNKILAKKIFELLTDNSDIGKP